MSICQRKVTDIIFVMGSGGELNEMSSVVLYSWRLSYFLDFYDIGICVLDDPILTPLGELWCLLGLG